MSGYLKRHGEVVAPFLDRLPTDGKRSVIAIVPLDVLNESFLRHIAVCILTVLGVRRERRSPSLKIAPRHE